jgi:hypothetical protein
MKEKRSGRLGSTKIKAFFCVKDIVKEMQKKTRMKGLGENICTTLSDQM